RLRIRFMSLFAHELVIKEVSLVNPTVMWAQNKDGKWRIPSAPTVEEQAPAATREVSPAAAAPIAEAAASPAQAVVSSPSSFTPEVRRVTLTNGNFHFLDSKQRPVAAFEGLRFRSSFRRTAELRGDASIAKISLRDRFFLEALQSPVKYDAAQLEFSNIKAAAAGGEITGRFAMQQAEPGSPFEAKVNFRDLEADRIVADAGGPKGMVQGRIEGMLEAQGKTADPNALAGAGEIYLRDGQLRQYTLLVALGQLLEIDELSQLRFEEAHVKYHITPGVVMIDELLLSSANIRVAAHGTVDFNGRLHLDSQLAINDRIRGQLLRGMQESFRPTEEAGFAAVDFKVSGTVEKPKTDLMGKLVGRDLRDLGGIISGLLGGGKKAKKEAAPAAEPTAPESSPTPVEQPVAPEPQPTSTP
ncbi:MAG: AsmA-like C-terminal region-containing protein, partial [Chthoniobacterales bacterium]